MRCTWRTGCSQPWPPLCARRWRQRNAMLAFQSVGGGGGGSSCSSSRENLLQFLAHDRYSALIFT